MIHMHEYIINVTKHAQPNPKIAKSSDGGRPSGGLVVVLSQKGSLKCDAACDSWPMRTDPGTLEARCHTGEVDNRRCYFGCDLIFRFRRLRAHAERKHVRMSVTISRGNTPKWPADLSPNNAHPHKYTVIANQEHTDGIYHYREVRATSH